MKGEKENVVHHNNTQTKVTQVYLWRTSRTQILQQAHRARSPVALAIYSRDPRVDLRSCRASKCEHDFRLRDFSECGFGAAVRDLGPCVHQGLHRCRICDVDGAVC